MLRERAIPVLTTTSSALAVLMTLIATASAAATTVSTPAPETSSTPAAAANDPEAPATAAGKRYAQRPDWPDARFSVARLLYQDSFRHGLTHWRVEAEQPAHVVAAGGVLDLDTPAGLTVWFKAELRGPVLIEYEAVAVSAGGPNDRVSDLNCFWMATDPGSPTAEIRTRSGAFADYNTLRTYYVGLGGNTNTTTRFRRYIGSESERPLLPQNDRSAATDLLTANRPQTIRLVADRGLIQYYRDGRKLFEYTDPEPYPHGWFALRTTKSHLRIRNFRIYRLSDRPPA